MNLPPRLSDHGWEWLELVPRPFQRPQPRQSSGSLLLDACWAWILQVSWYMSLVTGPKPRGAVADSLGGWSCFVVSSEDHSLWVCTLVWACHPKMALLGLGMHLGFTVSYLNPKAPTSGLLPADGCQIVVIKNSPNHPSTHSFFRRACFQEYELLKHLQTMDPQNFSLNPLFSLRKK